VYASRLRRRLCSVSPPSFSVPVYHRPVWPPPARRTCSAASHVALLSPLCLASHPLSTPTSRTTENADMQRSRHVQRPPPRFPTLTSPPAYHSPNADAQHPRHVLRPRHAFLGPASPPFLAPRPATLSRTYHPHRRTSAPHRIPCRPQPPHPSIFSDVQSMHAATKPGLIFLASRGTWHRPLRASGFGGLPVPIVSIFFFHFSVLITSLHSSTRTCIDPGIHSITYFLKASSHDV
jgi:hypothetical protein